MKNVRVNEKFIDNKLKLKKKIKMILVVSTLSSTVIGCGRDEEAKIINIGDHTEFSSVKDEMAIKQTHFFNNDLGLIVTPSKLTEASIYNDVEIVKNYITRYDITLPVYIDIQAVLDDRDTNLTNKKIAIHKFLDKCKKNDISVGVYGTDSILTQFYESLDFKEYGAYLVKDTQEVKYPGNIHVTKELNEEIKVREDLASAISEKNKNNKDKFIADYIHTISPTDTIDSVALLYDVSANSLLEYNGLSARNIKPGTKLNIPNKEANKNEIETGEYQIIHNTKFTSLETPLLGCDIAKWQPNPDWKKMKENFHFVIARSSYGTKEDSKFKEHAKNCIENDIKFGVYCFNTVKGTNYSNIEDFKAAALKQANFTVELLKGIEIDYPVYLDLENDKYTFTESINKEQIDCLLTVWKEVMEANGYVPGVYTNKSIYGFLCNNSSLDIKKEMEVWIAGGYQYAAKEGGIDIKDVKAESKVYDYKGVSYELDTHQVTSQARNAGAGNGQGNLDVNYTYVDYERTNEQKEVVETIKAVIENKEFNKRLFWSLKEELALAGISLSSAIILARKRKKEKKEKNIITK